MFPALAGMVYDPCLGFLIVRTDHLLATRGDFVMALRQSDLSFRRPPATGLLGHYPDRTHTGKPITAWQDTLSITIFTASSLNSGVKLLRSSGILRPPFRSDLISVRCPEGWRLARSTAVSVGR